MKQEITESEEKSCSFTHFANYCKLAKIVKLFGGKSQYEDAV